MDELADSDEITYVRFVKPRVFQGCRWVRDPLKQITKEPRRKKGKIDEAQHAFRIFKK